MRDSAGSYCECMTEFAVCDVLSRMALSGTSCSLGLLMPVGDRRGPERVPPAGPTVPVLEPKVDLAAIRVLQQPRAIGLPGSEQVA